VKDLQTVLRSWEAVIGLEVHTELTTLNTKMFCGCPITFGAEPNTHICPVCLGMPGALPVPNKAAIEDIVLAGLATNCDIEQRTMFYRKNYFYPDMSQNFQTTQGPVAFCMRGGIDLEVTGPASRERTELEGTSELPENYAAEGYLTHIRITRIHMEEDAGKLVHIGGIDGRITGSDYSLVDYNRVGTPLIELVTEPDLRTPEEARLFLQKLRQIYLTLGISDCSMEEGSLRCDGNVSLRKRGETAFGTKTELKNMNSFKNLHDGLAYEICRQAEVLEQGGTILQETRHWEPAAKLTTPMRLKETAEDYRYFPEPNLAPYDLSDEFVEAVRARLPELPDQKRTRLMEAFALPYVDATALAGDAELAEFFDAAMASAQTENAALAKPVANKDLAKPVANLLINDVSAYLNANNTSLNQTKLKPEHLVELANLVAQDAISSKQGKEVFARVLETGSAPQEIVKQEGMEQVSDTGALEEIAQGILKQFPDKVAEYQGGKTGLIGFFVGQAMQATKGQGNPKLINETFVRLLDVKD
jgi:aspartyl-tRNA(Asn)/glutamyl-tRNA(Gln) amidotransferase subunit B